MAVVVQVKREKPIEGAIPSTVYVDGAFFGYGLENDAYEIPAGTYKGFFQVSPKFGTKKLYMDVPGRSGIMFHGANVKDDLKGCIGIASVRNGAAIAGDLSGKLVNYIDTVTGGEGVTVAVSNPFPWLKVAIVAAAGGFIAWRIYKRRKRKTA
mgnify:CR=1 FL=1